MTLIISRWEGAQRCTCQRSSLALIQFGFVFAEPAVHQLADDEVQAPPSQLRYRLEGRVPPHGGNDHRFLWAV